MFNSAAVLVTPSKIFNSAVVDVTPSSKFISAAVAVTPSRILSSAAVLVTVVPFIESASVSKVPSISALPEMSKVAASNSPVIVIFLPPLISLLASVTIALLL